MRCGRWAVAIAVAVGLFVVVAAVLGSGVRVYLRFAPALGVLVSGLAAAGAVAAVLATRARIARVREAARAEAAAEHHRFMRIRAVLPAALLTATVALGVTACDVGVESDKKAVSPAATTPAPATPPRPDGGTAAPTTAPPATTPQPANPSAPTSPPGTSPDSAPGSGKAPGTASVPPAPVTPGGTGPIVISGTGARPTTDCTGRDVRVEGSAIEITFTGTCGTLTVTGEDHSIETGWFDRITLSGSSHLVLYGVKSDGSRPIVTDNGTSNRIVTK